MAQEDLDSPGGDIVQELAVMGDQQQRAAEGFQVILKPFDGLDVQMVRGLVEQKDIRMGKENLGQLDAHVPALAEGFRMAVQFVFLEAQAEKRPLRLHPGRLPRFQGQPVVDLVQAVDQTGVSG